MGAFLSDAQFGDSIEEFNWAHGLEWGYWKHPPLTTWLMIAYQKLMGFDYKNAYAVAFLCLVATLFFYYRLARLLLVNRSSSLIAVLLLSSSFFFTWRSQILNHNVTLTMMSSVMAWLFFYIFSRKEIKVWHWIFLGLMAALTFLAKYQAVIIFLSLFLCLFFYRRKFLTPKVYLGLTLAGIVFLLALMPHVNWILHAHSYIVDYTLNRFEHSPSLLERTSSAVSFLLQQVRFYLIPLALTVLCTFKKNNLRFSALRKPLKKITDLPWLKGLLFTPILFSFLLSLITGMKLMNHWGMAIFLFLPLALAALIQEASGSNIKITLRRYVVLQLLSLSIFALSRMNQHGAESTKRDDLSFPAKAIAFEVLQSWTEKTQCPLKFISGPAFEAGIVSVYSGSNAVVLENGSFDRSPWVNREDFERRGAVLISKELPSNMNSNYLHLNNGLVNQFPQLKSFYWTLILPAAKC